MKKTKNKNLLNKIINEIEGNPIYRLCAIVMAIISIIILVIGLFSNGIAFFFKNGEVPVIVPITNNNIVNISNTSEVKGKSINNNEYENHFNDNNWEIDGQWQKNEKTLTCEPNPMTKKDGGPKMININHSASSNFRMKVEFIPRSSSDEINFVISMGNFYRMVLGDGNRKFFYIKQGNNFISETNKDFKRPIELENEIRFDKPVEIEIIQRILSNTNVASIDVVIKYFPEENHNAEQTRENFHFQINNDSFYNNEEKIILGLLCVKNTVTAKFNYFYLKNN